MMTNILVRHNAWANSPTHESRRLIRRGRPFNRQLEVIYQSDKFRVLEEWDSGRHINRIATAIE